MTVSDEFRRQVGEFADEHDETLRRLDDKSAFRIVQGASVWIGPIGTDIGDPGWRHVGHTSEDAFYTLDEDEPVIDMDALRRGLTGGTISTVVAPKTRNRRRNPLHAVRDRLRRHHRERSRGRR